MNSLTVSAAKNPLTIAEFNPMERSPSKTNQLTKLKSQPQIPSPTPDPQGYFKSRRHGASAQVISFTKSETVKDLERQLEKSPFGDKPESKASQSETVSGARGFHVELRPSATAGTSALNEMYAETSITKLKRTARAIAALTVVEEENLVTSDKLPAFAAPLRLSRGTGNNMEALKPKRSLISAPKTRMMPTSDPAVLLNLISSMQQKRANELAKRQSEQSKLSENAAKTKSLNHLKPSALSLSELTRVTGNAMRLMAKRMGELFDKLAVA